MEILIRPMTAGDAARVLAIYAEGIADGNATFETACPGWPEWSASHLPEARLIAESERLLEALIEAADREGFWTLQGGTFEDNQASLAIWDRLGVRSCVLRFLSWRPSPYGEKMRVGKLKSQDLTPYDGG
jgi:L-amino acid N-acyltransferase YncA